MKRESRRHPRAAAPRLVVAQRCAPHNKAQPCLCSFMFAKDLHLERVCYELHVKQFRTLFTAFQAIFKQFRAMSARHLSAHKRTDESVQREIAIAIRANSGRVDAAQKRHGLLRFILCQVCVSTERPQKNSTRECAAHVCSWRHADCERAASCERRAESHEPRAANHEPRATSRKPRDRFWGLAPPQPLRSPEGEPVQ